jgi:amidase
MGEEGLSGDSSYGGLTVNPHNLNMSASGSSTGSAVAVAAGYAPLAIGAEFDGSIIAPSSVNGVVGLKPTVGLVGRSGVIPIGFTRDSLGPIGKSVEDVAIALEVLAGIDPEDPGRTVGVDTAPWAAFDIDPTPELGTGDYTSGLTPDALQGVRLGVLGNFRDASVLDEAFDAFDAILPLFEEAGATLVPNIWISDEGVGETYVNSLTEFAWGLQNYLNEFTPEGPMTTIQDIVDYCMEHSNEMDDFSGLIDALSARPLDDEYYLEVTFNNTSRIRAAIDSVMDENDVDAIIAPTASPAGPVDNREFGSTSGLTSLAGYPGITVPMGEIDGMPIGVHIFGRAFSEAQLLAYAYAIEQLLPPRIIPAYVPRDE